MIRKFDFEEFDFEGAYLIQPFYVTDERGGFVKDYNVEIFKVNGIEHELKEVFTQFLNGELSCNPFQL